MHITKICCTFAPELENNRKNIFYILTIKYNSQIIFIYKQQKVCHYEKTSFNYKKRMYHVTIQFIESMFRNSKSFTDECREFKRNCTNKYN